MAGGFLDFSGGYRGPSAQAPAIPSLGQIMGQGGGSRSKTAAERKRETLRDRFMKDNPSASFLGDMWGAMTGKREREAEAALIEEQRAAQQGLARLEVHDRVVGPAPDIVPGGPRPTTVPEYGPDYRPAVARAEAVDVDTAAIRDTMDKEMSARAPAWGYQDGVRVNTKDPNTMPGFVPSRVEGMNTSFSPDGQPRQDVTPGHLDARFAIDRTKAIASPPIASAPAGGSAGPVFFDPPAGLGTPPNSFSGAPVATPVPAPPPAAEPLRYMPPVPGPISSGFGVKRPSGSHNGIDFPVAVGTPVGAAADGVVEGVGSDPRSGTYVRLRHPDGSISSYAHLSQVNVKRGQRVTAGAAIALSGNTGRTRGANLHFVLRRGGKPVDPQPLFGNGAMAGSQTAGEIKGGAGADTLQEGATLANPGAGHFVPVIKTPLPQATQVGDMGDIPYDIMPDGSRQPRRGRNEQKAPDNPQEVVGRSAGMVNDFHGKEQVRRFGAASTIYRQMQSLGELPSDAGGPRDVAFITEFMKMVDPVGAVLEGDSKRAEAAAGPYQQAQAVLAGFKTGGKLTEETRSRFMRAASRLLVEQRESYDEVATRYRDMVARAGGDPSWISEDPAEWKKRRDADPAWQKVHGGGAGKPAGGWKVLRVR